MAENNFDPVFAELRFSVGEKIFDRFMKDAKVISLADNTAVFETPFAYAKDFIENRLGDKIRRALKVGHMRCVVQTA